VNDGENRPNFTVIHGITMSAVSNRSQVDVSCTPTVFACDIRLNQGVCITLAVRILRAKMTRDGEG
jgi:hypothetical protein